MKLKIQFRTIFAALMATTPLIQAQQDKSRPDILIADFEGETYGDWKVEGEAFGKAPAKGTLPRQQRVSGFKGKGLVNTFFKQDGTKGSLTSPSFKVERNYLSFLIGGGPHKNTCLQLLVDGKVVDARSGNSDETLIPALFDVSGRQGKTVQLRVLDENTGGWGHVNLDHIVQTDAKPQMPDLGPKEKEFTVENKYLVIPIRNKRGGGQIQLFVEGEEVRRYSLNIAPDAEVTDWYAYFTIENYKGKKARVVANKAT